jgi:hypothetical protein
MEPFSQHNIAELLHLIDQERRITYLRRHRVNLLALLMGMPILIGWFLLTQDAMLTLPAFFLWILSVGFASGDTFRHRQLILHLTHTDDLRVIGTLLEMRDTCPEADFGLLRLLPRLNRETAAKLTAAQREALYAIADEFARRLPDTSRRRALLPHTLELCGATVQALERIGGSSAFWGVRRLYEALREMPLPPSESGARLQNIVFAAYREMMAQRQPHEIEELLRPSSQNAADCRNLLTPAPDGASHAAQELLRPSDY